MIVHRRVAHNQQIKSQVLPDRGQTFPSGLSVAQRSSLPHTGHSLHPNHPEPPCLDMPRVPKTSLLYTCSSSCPDVLRALPREQGVFSLNLQDPLLVPLL